jgi:outer membrane protein
VLRAREAVTVREAALTSTREHLRVATELREAELRPKIDVVRAEVQVKEAEELLERARNQVAVAEAALAQAMGLNPAQNAVAPSQNILPSPILPETPDAAQERAISQRAELVQLRAAEQSAVAGVDAAASGLRPTVGLSAELTAERFTTMPETGDWSVMIGARWPISDAGETRARKREAQAQRDAISAQFEQIRNGVALEVQQAWLDLQSARRRESVAVVAVDQARESVRLAEEGYAAEVYPLSDLLDARAQLTAAEVRLVDARYEVRQAQERLLLAMGESAR